MNGGPAALPDDALVVRGGRPPYAHPRALRDSCAEHPDGCYGFSVQSAPGSSLDRLAVNLRNCYVGFTTVGEIRKMGYDVVRTSGFAHHATVVVPRGWSRDDSDALGRSFREAKNVTPRNSP